MTVTKQKLVSMLQYMRPAYSITEKLFCDKYLLPVFGEPDAHGNESYGRKSGERHACILATKKPLAEGYLLAT